jgi:hypothetical protein
MSTEEVGGNRLHRTMLCCAVLGWRRAQISRVKPAVVTLPKAPNVFRGIQLGLYVCMPNFITLQVTQLSVKRGTQILQHATQNLNTGDAKSFVTVTLKVWNDRRTTLMTPGVVEPLVKMSRDENSRWTRSTTLRASPSFWTGTKHLAGQALSDDAIGKPTWPAYHRPDKPCLACKLTRGKLFQRVVVPWDCQQRPSPNHTGTTSVYHGS